MGAGISCRQDTQVQAYLQAHLGACEGERFLLSGGSVALIGRASSNAIVLDHPDVAPIHCLMAPARDGHGFLLIDVWTDAGTLVNGRPFPKGVVGVGDVVGIGPFELEVLPASGARPRSVQASLDTGRPPRFQLVPRRSDADGCPLSPGSPAVVGRHELADVRLSDSFVSELHLLVALDPDAPGRSPLLLDLRSSNGTHLDGRPVHRAHVLPGQVIRAGHVELVVHDAEGARAERGREPDEPEAGEQPVPQGTTEILFQAEPEGQLAVPESGRRALDRPTSYQGFYGFDDLPFRLTADPDYFFESQRHGDVLKGLSHWLTQGRPVAVLCGPPGSGKSLLLACLARQLGYRRPAPVVMRPGLEDWTLDDLILATIARAAELHGELPAQGQTPQELWHAAAAELRRRNVLVAFLIDDADTAGRGFAGELGRLLETDAARVATRIVLAGSGKLLDLVAGPPLSAHLGARCGLAPLRPDEVSAYITHRLLGASGRRDHVFTRDAVELIAAWSRGMPRLINVAADAALFCACRADLHTVDRHTVAQAIREALGTDAPTDGPSS